MGELERDQGREPGQEEHKKIVRGPQSHRFGVGTIRYAEDTPPREPGLKII
jgi:hypothetical protein